MTNHIPLTPETFFTARQFVLDRWRARARELGRPEPSDLSRACLFASLFAYQVFGGMLQGNRFHQYTVKAGHLIDLTIGSEDLQKLREAGIDPHEHDPRWWANPVHLEAMTSCLPRVERWVEEFLKELNPGDGDFPPLQSPNQDQDSRSYRR
ncbi:MAG: hypothetical protein HY774_22810 [Acidobacteria bacterium]|nr:hypothetical protein [Acidobacteriota bacterium]